jgi:hypothetical protein
MATESKSNSAESGSFENPLVNKTDQVEVISTSTALTNLRIDHINHKHQFNKGFESRADVNENEINHFYIMFSF